jgi:hypothetical protein
MGDATIAWANFSGEGGAWLSLPRRVQTIPLPIALFDGTNFGSVNWGIGEETAQYL